MDTSESFLDSSAIKALGSRFKLTEVFLRDDGCSSDNQQVSSYPKHIRFVYDDDDDDDDDDDGAAVDDVNVKFERKLSSDTSVETSGSIVMEDAEFFQEMSALGLPLSFQTSKNSNTQSKGTHKLKQQKDQDNQCKLKDLVLVCPKLGEESQSYVKYQGKLTNSPDQVDPSCSGSDITDDGVKSSSAYDEEKPGYMVDEAGNGNVEVYNCKEFPRILSNEAVIDDVLGTDCQVENASSLNSFNGSKSCECYLPDNCVEKHPKELDRNLMEHIDTNGPGLSDAMQLDDLDSSICISQTQNSGVLIDSGIVLDNGSNENITSSSACGEWSTFWDSFYMRYYFYNFKTQESTWYPPPGMETFACGDVSNVSDKSNTDVNVDHTSSRYEDQLDQQEMVDNTVFDEQNGEKAGSAQQLTSKDLSSGTGVLLDIPCAVNIVDQHMRDEKCQDETDINSSLCTVNHNHHPQNESDQEVLSGSLFENGNKTFNGDVITRVSDASSLNSTVEAACEDDLIHSEHMEELQTLTNVVCGKDASNPTKQKRKKKNRRRKKSINKNDNYESQSVDDYLDITKYWCQRYLLFSKFDDGIRMDEEGWFSVTPEALARHHASRCSGGVVIDCFAGVGGNVIQFAKADKHVIAIDIDPKKIDYTRHNAAIYGVEDRIDFINEDCFSLASKLKADTVFLSPPWGGPDYLKMKSYDLSMLRPRDGQFLFHTFKVTASLIIMFLPRNIDIVQLAELCLSSDTPWSLEVEKNFLNGKLKAVTAYFSKPK